MNTLEFVQTCRAAIKDIERYAVNRDQVGERDQYNATVRCVAYLMSICTNPTLPSYQRMVEKAKAHSMIPPHQQVAVK